MSALDLLPADVRAPLPPLYATEQQPIASHILWVRWFLPGTTWTWYAAEAQENEEGDVLLFGLVCGFEREWGYYLLSDLTSLRGPLGLHVERDLDFQPCRFADVAELKRAT